MVNVQKSCEAENSSLCRRLSFVGPVSHVYWLRVEGEFEEPPFAHGLSQGSKSVPK